MNRLVSFILLVPIFLFSIVNCTIKGEKKEHFSDQATREKHKRKEVVIFVYHRFGDSRYPSTNIDLENFEKHLKYLITNNFTVFTLGEAVEYINNPQEEFIEHVACLTIDDGYKSFLANAVPLLNKYGLKATLFINSESVGGGSYMDWEDLRKVCEMGIEIGNHSHSHAYFLNSPSGERLDFFKEDVRICQEKIHQNLGFYPDIFAYPYGEFIPEMKSVLKEMGFKAAAAQNSGVLYQSDNYAIPRFPMAGSYTHMEGFIEKANMKALRVRSKHPESFLLSDKNPPTLEVEFDAKDVDLSRYSCFTSGNCETRLDGNTLIIKAKKALTARRTLYTVTVPSLENNNWHWFSHLWIQPKVDE